jgi:ring-1,2-phenylacetyl-CoA epoxidase subunit PaaA
MPARRNRQSMAWGIKRPRQRRAPAAVRRHDRAAGRRAGPAHPDDGLRLDEETGHYVFTQPDFTELYEVVKG